MARTPPTLATEVPGNFITSGLWNTQVNGIASFALTPPVFQGYVGTAASIPSSNTFSLLNMTAANWDSDGGWSSSVNPSRYTVQVAGKYWVVANAAFATVSGSDNTPRGVGIFQNGNAVAVNQTPANQSSTWQAQCTYMLQCAVGDYIQFGVMQVSGASRNTMTGAVVTPTLSVEMFSE